MVNNKKDILQVLTTKNHLLRSIRHKRNYKNYCQLCLRRVWYTCTVHIISVHYSGHLYAKSAFNAFTRTLWPLAGMHTNHSVHLYSTVILEIGKSLFWFDFLSVWSPEWNCFVCEMVLSLSLSLSLASVPQAICQGYQVYFYI